MTKLQESLGMVIGGILLFFGLTGWTATMDAGQLIFWGILVLFLSADFPPSKNNV